jgi:chromatin remodeling complex protein RSC6
MAQTRKTTDKAAGDKGGKAGAKKGGGGATRGALAQSVTPDATLAAVIGPEPSNRAEITKRIWAYIHAQKLQDPEDKRTIKADAKLKALFGGKDRVSMFEMMRYVAQHLK